MTENPNVSVRQSNLVSEPSTTNKLYNANNFSDCNFTLRTRKIVMLILHRSFARLTTKNQTAAHQSTHETTATTSHPSNNTTAAQPNTRHHSCNLGINHQPAAAHIKISFFLLFLRQKTVHVRYLVYLILCLLC